MANADVIANGLDVADQVDAAWEGLSTPMVEAHALVQLYRTADMESWSSLAIGTLERLLSALERYEHVAFYLAARGGMGAMAPMETLGGEPDQPSTQVDANGLGKVCITLPPPA